MQRSGSVFRALRRVFSCDEGFTRGSRTVRNASAFSPETFATATESHESRHPRGDSPKQKLYPPPFAVTALHLKNFDHFVGAGSAYQLIAAF